MTEDFFYVKFHFERSIREGGSGHVTGAGSFIFKSAGSILEVSLMNIDRSLPTTTLTSNSLFHQNFLNHIEWEYIAQDTTVLANGIVYFENFPLNGQKAINKDILGAQLTSRQAVHSELNRDGDKIEFLLFKFTLTRNPNPQASLAAAGSRVSELLWRENILVTEDRGVVGLVRDIKREHTLIAVETVEGTKAVTYLIDLVSKKGANYFGLAFGVYDGRIRFAKVEKELSELDHFRPNLIYSCKRELMELKEGQTGVFAFQHSAAELRTKLLDPIEERSNDPTSWPKFHHFGRESLIAASSAASFSNETGYSCFSWGRAILAGLNVPNVQLPSHILDRFVTLPSYHLPDSRALKWTQNPFFYTTLFAIFYTFIWPSIYNLYKS